MAPTLVWSKSHPATSQSIKATISPDPLASNAIRVTLLNKSLASNLVAIAFSHSTGVSVTSVIDNNAVSWTAGPTAVNGGAGIDTRIYYKEGLAATDSIVIQMSAVTADFEVVNMVEFYNVATSSAADGSTSSKTGTSASPLQPGSITTTQDGDLIWMVWQDTQQAFFSLNTAQTATPSYGGTPLCSHRVYGYGAQYQIQSVAGAINPTVTLTQPGNPDTFNVLQIAFKAAVAGTAPTIVPRIVHWYTHGATAGTTEVFDFPTTGDMLVVGAVQTPTQANMSAVTTSNPSNAAFTKTNFDTASPQSYHRLGASTGLLQTVNVTFAFAGQDFMAADIVGADATTTPVMVQATGAQSVAAEPIDITHGSLISAPALTPLFSPGLVMMLINFGTGPMISMIGPAGSVIDDAHYAGEDDGGNMNFGDGFAHFNYSTLALQAWGYNMRNATSSGWTAQALVINAYVAPFTPAIRRGNRLRKRFLSQVD